MRKLQPLLKEYWPDLCFIFGSVVVAYLLLNPDTFSITQTTVSPGSLPSLPKLPEPPKLPMPGVSKTAIVSVHSDTLVLVGVAVSATGLDVLLRRLVTKSNQKTLSA